MYHEGIVCDCCKVTLQAGSPFVHLEVNRVPSVQRSALDLIDSTPDAATCRSCGVQRTDENEDGPCKNDEDHVWSDQRVHRVHRCVDYCMSCFAERAPAHVKKLAEIAKPRVNHV